MKVTKEEVDKARADHEAAKTAADAADKAEAIYNAAAWEVADAAWDRYWELEREFEDGSN